MGCEKAKIYLASADWMGRNLDDRVEVLVPLLDSTVRSQILDQIMRANLRDTAQSWYLQSNGEYVRSNVVDGFCAQDYFMQMPNLSGLGSIKEDTEVGQISLD